MASREFASKHAPSADNMSPDVEKTCSAATDVACATRYLVACFSRFGSVCLW